MRTSDSPGISIVAIPHENWGYLSAHTGRQLSLRRTGRFETSLTRMDPAKSPGSSRNQRDSCTILLVDDNDQIREVVRRGLERKGFRVLLAVNRADAVKLLLVNPGRIDVVVSNAVIPRVGLATRFLFTSGRLSASALAALKSRPWTAFLPKPWSISELEAAIRGLLEQDRSAPSMK